MKHFSKWTICWPQLRSQQIAKDENQTKFLNHIVTRLEISTNKITRKSPNMCNVSNVFLKSVFHFPSVSNLDPSPSTLVKSDKALSHIPQIHTLSQLRHVLNALPVPSPWLASW